MKSRVPQNSAGSKGLQTDRTCAVCFMSSKHADANDPTTHMMTCSKCHANAHRFCYDPSLSAEEFLCDVCAQAPSPAKGKPSSSTCAICHNPGLLKRVKDKTYAHPLCLLVHPDVNVKTYRTLEFEFIDSVQKKRSVGLCSICNKKGEEIQHCSWQGCSLGVHLYCAIRDYNLKTESKDENEWVFNLAPQPANQHRHALLQLSIIQSQPNSQCLSDNIAADVLSSERDYERYGRHHIVACPEHKRYPCYCGGIVDDVNWIGCERCFEWYHRSCLVKEDDNQDYDVDDYTCARCSNWGSSRREQIIKQKQYPKLHVYDLVYMLCTAEQHPSLNPHNSFTSALLFCQAIPSKRDLLCQYTLGKLHDDLPILGQTRRTNQQSAGDLVHDHKLTEKVALLLGSSDKKKTKKKGAYALEEFNQMISQLAFAEPYDSDPHITNYIRKSSWRGSLEGPLYEELSRFRDTLINRPTKETVLEAYKMLVRSITNQKRMGTLRKIEENLPKILQFLSDPHDRVQEWINSFETILNFCKQTEERSQLGVLGLANLHPVPSPFFEMILSYIERSSHSYSRHCHQPLLTLDSRTTMRMSAYEQLQHLIGSEYILTSDEQSLYSLFLDKLSTCSGLQQAKAVLSEPLSRIGYTCIKQQLECWKNSQIQPSAIEVRACEEYAQQCEFVMSLEDIGGAGRELQELILEFSKFYSESNMLFPSRSLAQLERLYSEEVCLRPEVCRLCCTAFHCFLNRLSLSSITGSELRRYWKVARYLNMHADEEYLKDVLDEFMGWFSKDYRPIEQLRHAEVLDRPKEVEKYEKEIGRVLDRMRNMQVNVDREHKNLMGMLLWFKLAKKTYNTFFVEGSKMTVYAIKELVKTLNQSKFPKNKLYEKVCSHVAEAERLEKQLEQFSCKRRRFEPFTQVSIINSKPTVDQALKLCEQLRHSSFDFSFKIDDLEEEMKRFDKRKLEVDRACESRNLQELINLSRYFVNECPFRFEGYKQMRRLLIELRCHIMPKCKSELQQLLACAEEHVPVLISKCQKALDAYRDLDNLRMAAENGKTNEYVTIDRLNDIKANLLKDDAFEKSTLNSWITRFTSAKSSYEAECRRKANFENLNEYIEVMRRIPVRNPEIEADYRRKKEAYDQNQHLIHNYLISGYRGQTASHDEIIEIHESIKVLEDHQLTSHDISTVKEDLQKYFRLIEAERSPNIVTDGYPHFLSQCHSLARTFWSDMLYTLRLRLFEVYSRNLSERTPTQILRICYREACYLNTRHNQHREQLTKCISETAAWLEQLGQNIHDIENRQEGNDQMEEEEEELELEEGDSFEDDDDEDEDQIEEEEEEVAIHHRYAGLPVAALPQRPNPKKKPHPAEEIVIADDSEE